MTTPISSATTQGSEAVKDTAGELYHDWKFMKLVGHACCTACGIVRNDHNERGKCRGLVKARPRYHGHKTMTDGTHVPLTEQEAKDIWESIERATAERIARYPDERSAINGLMDAFLRLKELGWSEAIYCPKDGSTFDVIEMGSTGIHKCFYEGKWPDGSWWIPDDGDLYPSRPVLYRKIPAPTVTSPTPGPMSNADETKE